MVNIGLFKLIFSGQRQRPTTKTSPRTTTTIIAGLNDEQHPLLIVSFHPAFAGMAHRRSHHNPLPISPSPTAASLAGKRKYTLRPSPNSRRRALGLPHPTRSTTAHARRVETQSDDSDDDDEREEDSNSGRLRPVLAALHQNLRRLPSRLLLAATSATRQPHHRKSNPSTARDRDVSMRDVEETVQIGTKRKRVASSNENVGSHSTRGSRLKRVKATRRQQQMQQPESSSDEEMEVDTPTTWIPSEDSDADENAADSCQSFRPN
jgi:hypothetical protein